MSTAVPQIPNAQAPAVALPSGAPSREWFAFFSVLLTVIREQEARIAALEAK